jgi:hypothetical protein
MILSLSSWVEGTREKVSVLEIGSFLESFRLLLTPSKMKLVTVA